jgi:hypothetical protein
MAENPCNCEGGRASYTSPGWPRSLTQPTIPMACPRTRAWPWTQIHIQTSYGSVPFLKYDPACTWAWSLYPHGSWSMGWVPGELYDSELEVWLHIFYGSVSGLELNLDLELDLKFLMVIGWSIKIQDNHLHLDHILDLALDFSILKGAV